MNRRRLTGALASALLASPWSASSTLAQARPNPTMGWLIGGTPAAASAANIEAFRQGLLAQGYQEGQNLQVERVYAHGRYDRLGQLANELVGRRVDVIAATGLPEALAAARATASVPIVFSAGSDPVAAGLVSSLARPGGNVTGITIRTVELLPKRLEILCELLPNATTLALLLNPANAATVQILRLVEAAAEVNARQLLVLNAGSDSELVAAFDTMGRERPQGLLVAPDPFIFARRDAIVALAARHAIPAIYGVRDFATAGGLLYYGSNLLAASRQFAVYVGRILNGAKPADLPVHMTEDFELIVNLRTAKALDLTIPVTLLRRADETIE